MSTNNFTLEVQQIKDMSSGAYEVSFSMGSNTFDNKPQQLTVCDFDTFKQEILSRKSTAKGQYYFCSGFNEGSHPNTEKYPHSAHYRLSYLCQTRRFIAFDLDGFKDSDGFRLSLEYMSKYKGFGYTTASHTAEKPRMRAVFELNRVISRNEGIDLGNAFQNLMESIIGPDTAFFDPSVYRGEQPCYGPLTHSEIFTFAGSKIDVDELLAFDDDDFEDFEINTYVNDEIKKLFSPFERLGAPPLTFQNSYPYTPENAIDFLKAAEYIYPNGLPDYATFFELGMACAELAEGQAWPEIEARKILEFVGSKPEHVSREKNDYLWEQFISSTRAKIKKGMGVTGHWKILSRAKENGWKPVVKNSDALTAVQDKFALISLGGKIGIIDKQKLASNQADGMATQLIVMNRVDGGLLIIRFIAREFPEVDAQKILTSFFKDSNSTLYDGVEFNPTITSPDVLNLWVGPTIAPIKGEWPLIYSLLHDILCAGREQEYQYLIKYIAHALKRPHEKPGVMIILLGGQGIGKGTLAKILARIWGYTFLQTNRIKQIVGEFNGSLERAYFVFLDEALFVGDRSSSDALKSLVTEQTISINEKFQPARQITSFHRFISATNAEHFKATDRDDRRDFVLRVSEHKKGDYAYWNALNEEIENGGVEAFAHDLLTMDITGFNIRAKPNTRELTDQKLESLDKFPRWWFDCLSQGQIPNYSSQWPEFISSASLLQLFKDSEKTIRVYKQVIDRDLVHIMTKICPTAKREQSMEGQFRRRGYLLPPLNIARSNFEKYIGDKVEWENFDEPIEQ